MSREMPEAYTSLAEVITSAGGKHKTKITEDGLVSEKYKDSHIHVHVCMYMLNSLNSANSLK